LFARSAAAAGVYWTENYSGQTMALTKFTSCLAALTIFLNQGRDLLRAASAPLLFNLCFHAHKLPISRPKPSRWGSAVAYDYHLITGQAFVPVTEREKRACKDYEEQVKQ
jgi:hypothetical protein